MDCSSDDDFLPQPTFRRRGSSVAKHSVSAGRTTRGKRRRTTAPGVSVSVSVSRSAHADKCLQRQQGHAQAPGGGTQGNSRIKVGSGPLAAVHAQAPILAACSASDLFPGSPPSSTLQPGRRDKHKVATGCSCSPPGNTAAVSSAPAGKAARPARSPPHANPATASCAAGAKGGDAASTAACTNTSTAPTPTAAMAGWQASPRDLATGYASSDSEFDGSPSESDDTMAGLHAAYHGADAQDCSAGLGMLDDGHDGDGAAPVTEPHAPGGLLFCPSCQAPLKELGDNQAAVEAHIDRCVMEFSAPAEPCPHGASCSETDVLHFCAFNHVELALFRSNVVPSYDSAPAALHQDAEPSAPLHDTAVLPLAQRDQNATPPPRAAERSHTNTLLSFLGIQPQEKAATTLVRKTNTLCAFLGIAQPQPKQAPPGQQDAKKPPRSSFWSNNGKQRKCPFYKKLPDTKFAVDAFRYGLVEGVDKYFLTHFHSDHYGGLTKGFAGDIYCSEGTANLVHGILKVPRSRLFPIPMDTPTFVDGVEVTLVDANHCPGAAVIHYRLKNGRRYLHTGDFRASEDLAQHPLSVGVDVLYLDTTYCDPRYSFPEQFHTIRVIAEATAKILRAHPATLVVVGTYSIGKEKVFLGIAEALGCKVAVEKKKLAMLKMVAPEMFQQLTLDKHATQVHVLPIFQLTPSKLSAYRKKFPKYTRILCWKPTGWTHSDKRESFANIRHTLSREVTVYGVPYSEHSSFKELGMFVRATRPGRIIPTVNFGSAPKRREMEAHFAKWMSQ